MARLSKRLRFEILRRDNFQCAYCGARPPETELRVDHVIPEALGGETVPTNLVAACEPCNSGKTSIAPDSPMVESVEQDALRWGHAMRFAAESMLAERDLEKERSDHFAEVWSRWTHGGAMKRPIPLPDDFADTLRRLRTAGLSDELTYDAIQVAMTASGVRPENTFRYFAGICWRRVAELQDRARAILSTESER